ncbi:hypothetical protein QBC45DRAFT_339128 [Copromyces sp. CBS 386.78]|nr:hypothetical protein QBC45DRAFT_339128 [Copromyces sp. CBS 386.78]
MAPSRTDISSALVGHANVAASISLPAIRRASIQPEMSSEVRRYSAKAAAAQPDNLPIQAVDAVVRGDEEDEKERQQKLVNWGRWLNFAIGPTEGGDVLEPLEAQSRVLIDTWKRFSKWLPGMEDMSPEGTWIPTVKTLETAIMEAAKSREAQNQVGFGLLKDRFLTLMETLETHKNLFSIIPKGDKYVSLFTGVVSVIAKASANHYRTAEAFSIALQDVSEDLKQVKDYALTSDSPNMRRLVGGVYIEVFKFLCEALKWFKSKMNRVWASLHNDYYTKHVKVCVDGIKKAIQRIRDEANNRAHESLHELKSLVKQAFSQREIGSHSRLDDMEMIEERVSQMVARLGSSSVRALTSVEQQVAHGELGSWSSARSQQSLGVEHVNNDNHQTGNIKSVDPDEVIDEVDLKEVPLLHRGDLEQHIHRLLARYIEDGRADIARNPHDPLDTELPGEVIIHLQKWISELKSTTLWVSGEPVSPFGSGFTIAALRLIDVSKEIGIPCVSFICKQRYSFSSSFQSTSGKKGGASRLDPQEAGLIALFYSVIAQLIYLLPDEPFPANPVLAKSNFEQLDGTINSVPVALQIIKELATYAPPSLIWVLDNVHLIEGTPTVKHLKAFVEFLRAKEKETNASREEEKRPFSKVCYTTDGNSFVLSRVLDPKERVIPHGMARRRGDGPLIGGADVRDVGRRRRY